MDEARGKLVVISGPSGAGKTSVCRALKQNPNVEFSVSATTRVMREGERDGVDYHFLSRDDFQRRLGENQFLEWASYNDNLYGTPRWPMDAALARDKTFLVEIEVDGTRQLRERAISSLAALAPRACRCPLASLVGPRTESPSSPSDHLRATVTEPARSAPCDQRGRDCTPPRLQRLTRGRPAP